uniref:Uncharacterized protein n=1 Tax=Picea glauca TaxID=3330 RepID=A0A101M018_PICGL|nr:hypothetical protein ABT39_MTgene5405 [Picea glauca]
MFDLFLRMELRCGRAIIPPKCLPMPCRRSRIHLFRVIPGPTAFDSSGLILFYPSYSITIGPPASPSDAHLSELT